MAQSTILRRVGALALVALPFACGLEACSSDDEGPSAFGARGGRTGTVVDVDPVTGSADLIVAVTPLRPTVKDGDYEKAARDFIEQRKDTLKLSNPRAQLALVEVALGTDRTAHVSFAQRENGVRVEGVVIGVHFRRDGSVAMLTGPAIPDAGKTSTTPAVDAARAVAAAEADLRKTVPSYTATQLAEAPLPELVLVPDGRGAKLAWKLSLRGASFGERYFVDAQSGAVLNRVSLNETIEGSGVGVLGDVKRLNVRELPAPSGRYAMYQGGVPGAGGRERIVTYTWTGETTPDEIVRSNDPNRWDVVSVGSGSAVDAHAGLATVAEWFRTNVRWASFDGRGSPIKVVVHDNRVIGQSDDGTPITNNRNAFWDHAGGMHFGDGDQHLNGNVRPTSVALDVVAHELMHGVVQYTSGLPYQGQTGALNEALADIFGTFVEASAVPSGSQLFRIGEVAFPDGIRDLAHPSAKDQPDHMSRLYTGSEDKGGVHINSGIINNAWYLMTWGGENDTSKLQVSTTLGMDTSRRLWWHTARFLLGPNATFDRAARQQTGWAKVQGMPLEAVACAWVATGVLESDYVKTSYGVDCGSANEAGTGDASDAGAEDPEPPPTDSCRGREDGVYCSELVEYSAIVCEGGLIAGGQQCADLSRCIGPNGSGTRIACEGEAPAPPPPPDDNAPMPPDSCEGKADGVYCSALAPFSSYRCQGGSISGGLQCPDDKTCAGPNGPGELICR